MKSPRGQEESLANAPPAPVAEPPITGEPPASQRRPVDRASTSASEVDPRARGRRPEFERPIPEDSETRLRPYGVPLDPEGVALRAEFEAVDFDTLGDAEFASFAAEFAARARHRQERGLVIAGNDFETRIIRRLTALVSERRLPRPIFGLARSHRGDWLAIAKRARDDRERRAAAAGRADRAPGDPSNARVPPVAKSAAPPPQDDEPDETPLDLPRLRARAHGSSLVVVGGVAKPEKLERLRRRAEIEIEWIGLDAGKSASTVAALARRIRDGRLVALVLLNGLLDHKQSEPLMTAAREVGLAVAYADKAGKGAFTRALMELERRLGGEPPAAL
jgi:hypothetical protein